MFKKIAMAMLILGLTVTQNYSISIFNQNPVEEFFRNLVKRFFITASAEEKEECTFVPLDSEEYKRSQKAFVNTMITHIKAEIKFDINEYACMKILEDYNEDYDKDYNFEYQQRQHSRVQVLYDIVYARDLKTILKEIFDTYADFIHKKLQSTNLPQKQYMMLQEAYSVIFFSDNRTKYEIECIFDKINKIDIDVDYKFNNLTDELRPILFKLVLKKCLKNDMFKKDIFEE